MSFHDEPTQYSEIREILHKYHNWRKQSPLNERQQKRVQMFLEDWKLYRSDEVRTFYKAYGLYEFPVIYMSQADIDDYVINDAEYCELEDFEYCVETVQMTGREFGELLADW